jgi:O-antigen ligase
MRLSHPRIAIDGLITALLVIYPILTLIVAGAVNTVFFLLFLLSVGILVVGKITRSDDFYSGGTSADDMTLSRRDAWIYVLAMAGLPLSILISQWVNDRWGWPYYDAASRFLLAVPIFFALRRLDPERLLSIWYGFALGALMAGATAHFAPHDWGSDQGVARIGTSFVNPIHFGDIALILGVLPLFGLARQHHRDDKAPFVFDLTALIAAICGLYASILSGSRGGWIALPIFFLLAFLFYRKQISARSCFLALLGALLVGLIFYRTLPDIHNRVSQAINNLHAFDHGNENTSIGIRFQLWKAAWLIFIEHPVFGVGMGGFKALMTPMQQMGELTPLAADFGRQEVHSEILSRLSQLGLVGLTAILAVYAVPAWLFWRRIATHQLACRAAARMGIALICGFFVFGLTVETFDLTMTAAFYALTTAVLLAAAYPTRPTTSGR